MILLVLNDACVAEKGFIKLSTYLIPYRVGDIVDIKANAAPQRGMPHKYYHGCVSLTFYTICIACADTGLCCDFDSGV